MNEHNINVAQKLLYEYGSAIRGDWSDVDGRTVRSDLEGIAKVLDFTSDIVNIDIVEMRKRLDLCLDGTGQWLYYCETGGCACVK